MLLKFDAADFGAQKRLCRRGAAGRVQKDAGPHDGLVVVHLVHIFQPEDVVLDLLGKQRQELSRVAVKGWPVAQREKVSQCDVVVADPRHQDVHLGFPAVQVDQLRILRHMDPSAPGLDVVHQDLVAVPLLNALHPQGVVHVERRGILQDLSRQVDRDKEISCIGKSRGQDVFHGNAGHQLGYDVGVPDLPLRLCVQLQFYISKDLGKRGGLLDPGGIPESRRPVIRENALIEQAHGDRGSRPNL